MLTESLFLGIAGGVGGLELSFAGLRAVVALRPGSFPRVAELGSDTRIFILRDGDDRDVRAIRETADSVLDVAEHVTSTLLG